MKRISIILMTLFCVGAVNESSAQFAFTVNPGLNYNGATFGYKLGNFVPYLGVTYLAGSNTSTLQSTQWNSTTLQMESFTSEYKIFGQVIIPTLGMKYYFVNSGDLKAYGNINVTKPLLAATYENDGVIDQSLEDYVKNISIWGGELGFGAEYYFSEQFSIGGEFGLRAIRAKYEEVSDVQVFNPITGLSETFQRTFTSTGMISPTYARISLNFFFGKGGRKTATPQE